MNGKITRGDDRRLIPDSPAEATVALGALAANGLRFLVLSALPIATGKSRPAPIAWDRAALSRAAGQMGLDLSAGKPAFLPRGGDCTSTIVDLLRRPAEARIHATSVRAIAGGADVHALLWIKPEDAARAAAVRYAQSPEQYANRIVDETSEESFPASDAPAGTLSRRR